MSKRQIINAVIEVYEVVWWLRACPLNNGDAYAETAWPEYKLREQNAQTWLMSLNDPGIKQLLDWIDDADIDETEGYEHILEHLDVCIAWEQGWPTFAGISNNEVYGELEDQRLAFVEAAIQAGDYTPPKE